MSNSPELTLEFHGPDKIRSDLLDTFPYSGAPQTITYTSREFSAVCPFSGLPDLATVQVTYIPDALCIELKSLKLYFVSYRSIGMYQEDITNRIFQDLWSLIKPKWLQLETIYATRGGIDARCVMEQGNASAGRIR